MLLCNKNSDEVLFDITTIYRGVQLMSVYTYPINEVETTLQSLVKQARSTRQPVVLTSEETAQPIAVVMEMDAFEQTQRYQQRLFYLQLIHLENWLDKTEQQWDDETIRKGCVNAWQESVKLLWDLAPEPIRKFAASLILSVQKLTPGRLTQTQLAALRHSLTLFRYPALDEATKKDAYQRLTACGLSPRFVLDNETIQSYLEES